MSLTDWVNRYIRERELGGVGSGNHGHKGRPGQVGGSRDDGSTQGSSQGSMKQIEKEMSKQSTESGYLFGADGKLILSKKGNENSVRFTSQETSKMRNGIYTHNHPNGSWFSIHDVYFSAEHDLAQMRAVSGDRIYVLDRPSSGWPSMSQVEGAHNQAISQANSLLHSKNQIVGRDFIPLKVAELLRLPYYSERFRE